MNESTQRFEQNLRQTIAANRRKERLREGTVREQVQTKVVDTVASGSAITNSPMKTGIQIITEERARQISKEGWSALHDSEHIKGELSAAGASYAMAASVQIKLRRDTMADITPPSQWPWDAEWWKLSDDPVRTLAKAGALIAAEIDRLQLHRQHVAGIELKPGRGLADS